MTSNTSQSVYQYAQHSACHALDLKQVIPSTYVGSMYNNQLIAVSLVHLAHLLKASATRENSSSDVVLCIGYSMKHSRQCSLVTQGMLPFVPVLVPRVGDSEVVNSNNQIKAVWIFFVPLLLNNNNNLHESIEEASYVDCIDIFLHKPSDFLVQRAPGSGNLCDISPELLSFLHAIEKRNHREHVVDDQRPCTDSALRGTSAVKTPTFGLHGADVGSVHIGEIDNARTHTHSATILTTSTTPAIPVSSPRTVPKKKILVVDPLASMHIVMDRHDMCAAIDTICLAARKRAMPVRSPSWMLLESLQGSIIRRAADKGIFLPCIMKPRVACGVTEAHQMAFVMHASALQDVGVPLPAILQEYVDHGGVLWKVYVAGKKVFVSQRKSTPDLMPLKELLYSRNQKEEKKKQNSIFFRNIVSDDIKSIDGRHTNGMLRASGVYDDNNDDEVPACIEFDSLESLPVTLPWQQAAGRQQPVARQQQQELKRALLRPEFLEALAHVARDHLRLTLFGFDVVFDAAAGEAVMIDINYFPSFKGIEGASDAVHAALCKRWIELTAL